MAPLASKTVAHSDVPVIGSLEERGRSGAIDADSSVDVGSVIEQEFDNLLVSGTGAAHQRREIGAVSVLSKVNARPSFQQGLRQPAIVLSTTNDEECIAVMRICFERVGTHAAVQQFFDSINSPLLGSFERERL